MHFVPYSDIGLTIDQKEPYCRKLLHTSLFSPDVWNSYFHITALISGIAMAFIAYTIFFYKQLRVHPAQLVGIFSLAISALIFMSLGAYLICPGNAEVLFA